MTAAWRCGTPAAPNWRCHKRVEKQWAMVCGGGLTSGQVRPLQRQPLQLCLDAAGKAAEDAAVRLHGEAGACLELHVGCADAARLVCLEVGHHRVRLHAASACRLCGDCCHTGRCRRAAWRRDAAGCRGVGKTWLDGRCWQADDQLCVCLGRCRAWGGRGRAGAVLLCSAGHVNVNVNVPLAMPGQA